MAWSSRRTVSRPLKPFLLANIPRRQRKVDSTSNAQAFGRGRETCRCYAIGSEPSSRRRSVKLARSLSRSHPPRYHRGIRMRRRDLPRSADGIAMRVRFAGCRSGGCGIMGRPQSRRPPRRAALLAKYLISPFHQRHQVRRSYKPGILAVEVSIADRTGP